MMRRAAVRVVATAALLVSGPCKSGMTAMEVQLPPHDAHPMTMTVEFPARALDPSSLRTTHGAPLALKVILTNRDSERHRVASYRSIVPEITNGSGAILTFHGGTNRTREARAEDFPWLEVGASLALSVDASLSLHDGQLAWSDAQGLSGTWAEKPDKAAGPYHLRFRYQVPPQVTTAFAHELHIRDEDLWTGSLTTQLIELPLDSGP